jgi:hypothetical protein
LHAAFANEWPGQQIILLVELIFERSRSFPISSAIFPKAVRRPNTFVAPAAAGMGEQREVGSGLTHFAGCLLGGNLDHWGLPLE